MNIMILKKNIIRDLKGLVRNYDPDGRSANEDRQ